MIQIINAAKLLRVKRTELDTHLNSGHGIVIVYNNTSSELRPELMAFRSGMTSNIQTFNSQNQQ